jgi:type II secretory pathway pseudopilin PulG
MISVAVIAIIASMAIPRLTSARISANETTAISTLRTLFTAQAQLVGNGSVDTDADGAGEFAYFGELCGTVPARVSAGGFPAAGALGVDELDPSPLLTSLGNVTGSTVARTGYMYQIWLPGPAAAGAVPGIPEDVTGGKLAGPFPDSDECEVRWCAYAWPIDASRTGNRVYFINEQGLVLSMSNPNGVYDGAAAAPPFDAVFTIAGDMSSPLAINGAIASDGNTWLPSN